MGFNLAFKGLMKSKTPFFFYIALSVSSQPVRLCHLFCNAVYIMFIYIYIYFFFCGAATQRGSMTSSFLRFLDHTQQRTTVSRTPLDEWLAHRRNLYLKTHNTHNRQTSMPPVRFEPTISAGERLQTYALGLAATGTG